MLTTLLKVSADEIYRNLSNDLFLLSTLFIPELEDYVLLGDGQFTKV